MGSGDHDTPFLSRLKMLRFLKKPWKSSQKPGSAENLTHRKIIDTGAEHGGDPKDVNRGGDYRIANQDGRVEDQRVSAPKPSTPTPGDGGGVATPQGQRHIIGGSAPPRSEQLVRNIPGPHFTERDSKILHWRGHEDQGPGIRQPSETVPGRTSGGGRGGGNAHNLTQSGRSGAKEGGRDDPILRHAELVAGLTEGTAEPFGPLKAVSQSISDLYTQYQNTATVKDKIEILRSRIIVLEELFEKPAGDEKEKKLREGLSTKLEDVEEQLQSLRGESALLRFVDNAQAGEDVNRILEDIQEAVNDYMMVQQMAIYDQGCQLMDTAETLLLNNFRCARGAEFRHGERKGCLKGTRGAVLSGIELWARDFDKSSVYWLNGLAGTGKSTIAKTIAERLFAGDQLGASFFCSRDFEDRRNLQFIFPTLAAQLARKYTKFRSILVSLIQSDPEIAYVSLYSQMKKLIVQPLSESGISTVIFIDALDECEDEESASAILFVLGQLVSMIPKVKFFLTGRPEPRISEGFRLPLLAKMTDVFVLHNVEPDQVDSDIRVFFKNSFSELADRRPGLDGWPANEQLDRLCKRAAGLFVYAAATAKFIGDNKRDPRTQLNVVLWSSKVGEQEGRSLDSLYTAILQQAFGDDKPEDDAKTRSVLGAVVLATNPLPPSAIATLLGLNAKYVLPLLSSFNSLLILQEDVNHPVRPFHKSFPDFITDPSRCTNDRFHISPQDHHSQLLIRCLVLMNRVLEKNMCKLPEAVANSDVTDLKERTEKYINPALRYACMSWHMHLVDARTIPAHVQKIAHTLRQFLEKKFLFWLEVLSVLGGVRNAVEALQATMDWLEESPTLNLVDDCFRFVTGYLGIITASSQHIYHSALVLTPKKSLVRNLYESHTHPFTRVVYGGPVSWDTDTTATTYPSRIELVVWSPCNRFIAIAQNDDKTVDVLDSVALQRLQALEYPQGISSDRRALVFSPDSRILTCSSGNYGEHDVSEIFVVSWDLQTGGVASVIQWQGPEQPAVGNPSITYSTNGKMVGVFYPFDAETANIFICDVASGVYMHCYPLDEDNLPLDDIIWTHGEFLRFATTSTTDVTIWEIGFTSGTTPTEVETLPVPESIENDDYFGTRFLLAPRRLALGFSEKVVVWDTQNCKHLLDFREAGLCRKMSFSDDRRFFACSTRGSDIYLWKESPTGYILHEKLASSVAYSQPLLSRNGRSIVAFENRTIQLWHTKSFTTTPSSILTRGEHFETFALDFSPDGTLAVVAMRKENVVTVLNLKSGVPQLTIDTCIGVEGLGVIGNTVVVIGDQKVITWDLPAGDCVPDARVGLEDSSRTINLGGSWKYKAIGASISPDSRHIALTARHVSNYLYVYSASTGKRLGMEAIEGHAPWFAPDGCDVWCAQDSGVAEMRRVSGGQKVLELVCVGNLPQESRWVSSRGYQITKDWWILGPEGKRLLMLPPLWQSWSAIQRVWKGQFLALLHGGLSEPVILELDAKP